MKVLFKMTGATILVLGASGFLGSHLCRVLKATGNQIHAVSRTRRLEESNVRWWLGDLSDLATARRIIAGIKPELIFHLTTHGWAATGMEHLEPTLRNDLMATVNVLTAATESKVRRIVVAGSLEEPQAAADDHVPSSPYAAAKAASAAYTRLFHRLYETPTVTTRIAMTYGPGQPAQKLIPYVIRSMARGESPRLSDGRRLVDWIFVDDVIAGLLAAAEAEHVEGQTFDLGSGTRVSVRELVERLELLVGASVAPTFGALPSSNAQDMPAARIEEAYAGLGWSATTPLEVGLELTAEWYKAQLTDDGGRNRAGDVGHGPRG